MFGTLLLYKGESEFPKFSPKKRVLILLIKSEVWWNRVVVLKREGGGGGTISLIFIITSTFPSYLCISECWCLFCIFTPYLSEFFVFHRNELISLNHLINWYLTFTSLWFFNSKDTGEFYKVNFDISKLFIEWQLLWAQNRWS